MLDMNKKLCDEFMWINWKMNDSLYNVFEFELMDRMLPLRHITHKAPVSLVNNTIRSHISSPIIGWYLRVAVRGPTNKIFMVRGRWSSSDSMWNKS